MAKRVTDAVEFHAGLVTRKGASELFGVSMMTITKWERDGFPVHTRGSRGRPSMYAMPDCIRWFSEREVRARGGEGSQTRSPQEQRALLDGKRTEELELRIQLRRGELVEADEAARDLATVATATKSRLRRIPDAEADRLVGACHGRANCRPAVRKVLAEAIDQALQELAAHGEPEASAA